MYFWGKPPIPPCNRNLAPLVRQTRPILGTEIWSRCSENRGQFWARNPCLKSASQNWYTSAISYQLLGNSGAVAKFASPVLGTDSVPEIGLVFRRSGSNFQ